MHEKLKIYPEKLIESYGMYIDSFTYLYTVIQPRLLKILQQRIEIGAKTQQVALKYGRSWKRRTDIDTLIYIFFMFI